MCRGRARDNFASNPRREGYARLTKRVLAGQRLTYDERVHLVRPLVREHGLEVVHVPDHWILERDAVAAEDGARRAARFERAADVAHLAEAHVLRTQRPLVLHAAEVQRDERAPVDLEGHLRELLLGELVAGDRLVEDGAIAGVLQRRF